MRARTGPILLLAGGPGGRRDAYAPLLRGFLALPGKAKPSVAYLGAATGDDRRFTCYMKRFLASAGECDFRLAPVAGRAGVRGDARTILDEADLIFLGGGDVEIGMRRLAERDLEEPLRRKHAGGTPLLGVSAGAILLARSWVRWRDPEDDGSAELFDCLGLAPLLCDCHGEEDGWSELHALLRLAGDGAVGHGIRSGAALRVGEDGKTALALGTVDRLSLRGGVVVPA